MDHRIVKRRLAAIEDTNSFIRDRRPLYEKDLVDLRPRSEPRILDPQKLDAWAALVLKQRELSITAVQLYLELARNPV